MNTIRIKNFGNVYLELEAADTITPGMLIEETSAGKVQAHSSVSGNALPMFALEDELRGGGIDDDYGIHTIDDEEYGDQVSCTIAQRGDEIYAILDKTQVIAKGDFLESAGNGYLQKHIPKDMSAVYRTDDDNVYVNPVVGVALESVTTTSKVARIKVRIL